MKRIGPSPDAAGKARNLTGTMLIFFGALALGLGGWAWVAERALRARAVEAEARVTAHEPSPRLSYSRMGYGRDQRPVPRLDFTVSSGAGQRAWLYPWHVEQFPVGQAVPILYDPAAPERIRLADEPVATGLMLGLGAGGLVGILGGVLVLRRRSPAPAPPAFAGPLPPGRPLVLHSLAGWPVMEMEPPRGGKAVLAMDRATGAMVPRHDLWDRLRDGSIDLDTLEMDAFRSLLRTRRNAIVAAQCQQGLSWQETGDAEFPFAGDWAGAQARLRLNDHPAEPLFSVIVQDQNVGNLEAWPEAWTRQRPAARGSDV